VLAGGRSRRFGRDKALAKIAGVTFLEKLVWLCQGMGLETTVITHPSRDYSFLDLGCDVQADLIPEKGPLGGLYTACRLFEGSSLLVLSCDMPALDERTLEILMKSHRRKTGITLFCDGKRLQPFPGIYESYLGYSIFERLRHHQLSMHEFLAEFPCLNVVKQALGPKRFLNINTQKDWLALAQ
jgi:molybdopterin-guanine dinucleotide biosynthesis protein A